MKMANCTAIRGLNVFTHISLSLSDQTPGAGGEGCVTTPTVGQFGRVSTARDPQRPQ